jgi:hypothetical protein
MNPTCLTHYFIRSKISSGCLGHRFNRDLKAERFKSLNEFVLERFRVEAIEVVSAKIPILVPSNVEGNDKKSVGRGNGGLLYAAAGGHSPELCGKIIVFLGGDRPCGLAEATT